MKDIDFDELDKAVNSLMSSSPQADSSQASQKPIESAAPIQAPTVSNTDSAPVITEAPASLASPVSEQPLPERQPAPAARRSGRFMDMVSTPGGQKGQQAVSVPSVPSREGLSITPRAQSVAFQPQAVEAAEPDHKAEVAMPDPIDLSVASSTEVQSGPDASKDGQPSLEPEVQQLSSLESPFIADAKVEKRPLNAGTSEGPIVDLTSAMKEDAQEGTSVDEPSPDPEGKNGDDEPPIVPQVAELDSNLIAIEASENPQTTQAVETADAMSEVESKSASAPLGATSIPQQYTAQPSSGDQSHAAIYDASQYPEPVAHPAKSKSGWLWVLWVVLLLGIGAGGAIVLYNLGII